ncbi:cytochrome P450 9e2-like isoform X3 [Andrena cerasifolii]|uniref:cytochrome P450 9e2-like isoform X3 n=1 Tax=Andrena cerasifolii TaxID=2819439 RepID=UPI0040380077
METWSVVLALVAAALSAYYYLKRNFDYFEKRGIPYKKPLPLFGNAARVVFKRVSFAQEVIDLYNMNRDAKYVGYYEFMKPMIMVRDVELAREIMVKHFEHFQDHRGFQNGDTDIVFSKNLVALRGERWKEVRNVLTPVFTSSKMKAMFQLMSECAERYGDTLSNLTEKERVLDLKEIVTRYTSDTIATCAFGITLDTMADPTNKFYVHGREFMNFGMFTILKVLVLQNMPWVARILRMRIVKPELENFFKQVIANTLKTRQETGIYRPDLIQTLMEANEKLGPDKQLTVDDMTANATLFFAGGLENTSNLMSFAAYEVAVNKGVQENLQKEIDEVLGRCNGNVTYDAINDMKYLDGVVHETLRLYPTALMTDRVCTKRFELPPALPGGKPLVLEEGAVLQIPIYAIQRDPRYYDDPNTFNIERYGGDFRKVQNSETFLTFGQGPRLCIANRFAMLVTKVLLFHLFAKCTLKSCSKTVVPMKFKKAFALFPENGFWFEVVPREEDLKKVINED